VTLRQAMINKMIDADYICENCGEEVPPEFRNVAHIETKNGKSKEWARNPANMVVCCFALHNYETNKPGNLENHPCVKKYLAKYNTSGKFWADFRKRRSV